MLTFVVSRDRQAAVLAGVLDIRLGRYRDTLGCSRLSRAVDSEHFFRLSYATAPGTAVRR